MTVLSPHRDDAAFSLFIALSKWISEDVNVSVLNFFTVSDYAPHSDRKETKAVSEIRRYEDLEVLHGISSKISIEDLGLVDAPLRLHLPLSLVCDRGTAESLAEGEADKLQSDMERIAEDDHTFLLAPLSLGDHVDHVAVHRASLLFLPVDRLGFYEDLPYATWTPESRLQEKKSAAETKMKRSLEPFIVRDLSAADRKAQGIAKYRSQITSGDAESMAEWSKCFGIGERMWVPSGFDPLTRSE